MAPGWETRADREPSEEIIEEAIVEEAKPELTDAEPEKSPKQRDINNLYRSKSISGRDQCYKTFVFCDKLVFYVTTRNEGDVGLMESVYSTMTCNKKSIFLLQTGQAKPKGGGGGAVNTKWGSITVPLTSCLTGLH